MRSIIIVAIAASAAVAGCTFKSTTVRQGEAPPVVYEAPAPIVVYQSPPPTVVYQQQQPVMYSAPSTQSVSVTYKGPNGYQLAWGKATTYCDVHYGNSRVRLVSDDQVAGRATFACDQL